MAGKSDPYAHRAYRQKYKGGYGCEGAARGINELPASETMSPKEQSYAAADKDTGKGKEEKGEAVEGQMSKTRATYISAQKSKTRPNPY